MEEWRSIPGFPDYEVSSWGRVRRCTPGKGAKQWGVLVYWLSKRGGYPAVKLRANGKSSTKEIHKLVLLAWHGARPEGMDGCHRNGNVLDNTPENLYYGSRSENVRDAMRHGTWFNVGKDASRWR